MNKLKFYTFRINKTGKIRYAIADTAQHATAVFGEWIGVCTILATEELPPDIKAVALNVSPELNSDTVYRGE